MPTEATAWPHRLPPDAYAHMPKAIALQGNAHVLTSSVMLFPIVANSPQTPTTCTCPPTALPCASWTSTPWPTARRRCCSGARVGQMHRRPRRCASIARVAVAYWSRPRSCARSALPCVLAVAAWCQLMHLPFRPSLGPPGPRAPAMVHHVADTAACWFTTSLILLSFPCPAAGRSWALAPAMCLQPSSSRALQPGTCSSSGGSGSRSQGLRRALLWTSPGWRRWPAWRRCRCRSQRRSCR